MSYHYRKRGIAALGAAPRTTTVTAFVKELVAPPRVRPTPVSPPTGVITFPGTAPVRVRPSGLFAAPPVVRAPILGNIVGAPGRFTPPSIIRPGPPRFTSNPFTSIMQPVRGVVALIPTPNVLDPNPPVQTPLISTQPAPSSGGGGGGGGGGGDGGELETEDATVTPDGAVVPTAAVKAPFPTRTALLIGGGLVAAYLLFGNKKGKRR